MIINKKHVIFDWNGTLVDDAWVFVDILNQLLVPRGFKKITVQEYRNLFCFPIKSFYTKLGVDVSGESFLLLENEFVNEYNKRKYLPKLFQNVPGILNELIREGMHLSILSASNENILCGLVKYYKLYDYFDYVVGVDNYGANGKVDSGFDLLKKLGGEKKDIILIGDTDYDYEVALELDLDCVLVAHGHQSSDNLKKLNHTVINSLDGLINQI